MLQRLFNFPGGIKLREHKRQSTSTPVEKALIPHKIILPLKQHIGSAAIPCVNVGDKVLKGQVIAESARDVSVPIHASTSGTISDIGNYPVPHPSGLNDPCIVIIPDGEDRWIESKNDHRRYDDLSREDIRNIARMSGIVGLGGAGFPSYLKLHNNDKPIELLILNGAECEPYITCDDMLMREQAEDIIKGVQIMLYALSAKECIFAIENNKPEAYKKIFNAVKEIAPEKIQLVKVPTLYPAGGEKQLIQTLTGREVPSQGLPLDIGIVCHNVGTAHALTRAVLYNEPLVSRYVTVAGGVEKARVLNVLLGTPVGELIAQCGGNLKTLNRIIMGGPMMGFALHDMNVPVVKITNCILATSKIADVPLPSRSQQALPCIRCGFCAQACPVGLLPQQLYWYARAKEFDKVQDYNIFDCIECGCCDYVCPSHIPLVQYYRFAKTTIWQQEREKTLADISRERHEFHKARLEREKKEREERHKKKRQTVSQTSDDVEKKAAIQAAMERARMKREQNEITPKNVENLTEHQKKLIEEVDARRRKKLEEHKQNISKKNKPS